MRIEVDRLESEGETYAHTYGPDELSLNDEHAYLLPGAKIEGSAERKGSKVRLRGKISARVEAPCDRCAQLLVVPIEVEFDAPYMPAEVLNEATEEEGVELAAPDLDLSFYPDDSIDIDELMREQVLLALPTRLLCREDCRGLCVVCGADLNTEPCGCGREEVDPRWAGLAALKPKQQ